MCFCNPYSPSVLSKEIFSVWGLCISGILKIPSSVMCLPSGCFCEHAGLCWDLHAKSSFSAYYLDYFPNGCKNTHLNDSFRVVIVFRCCNLFIRDGVNASEFVKTTSLAFAIFL